MITYSANAQVEDAKATEGEATTKTVAARNAYSRLSDLLGFDSD
jgi:hypothetical protein